MPVAPKAPSHVEFVRSCKASIASITDSAKQARLFLDECKAISALVRQLTPFLDDLEDNQLEPGVGSQAVDALQALQLALQRVHTSVSATTDMGPFYALLNQEGILGEFVNAATDMLDALQKLDAKTLQVDAYHQQSLGLLQAQLSKLSVSYTPCTTTSQMVVELRNEAEAVRTGAAESKSLPHSQLSAKYLQGCTVAQLSNDVAYLRAQLAQAQEARKHVEAFFLSQLIALETPLLPADAKLAKTMATQVVVAAPEPQAPEPAKVDPLPLVQELLKTLTTPTASLEQRAEALRPLVGAAGLDPEGFSDPNLHSGAVLYALTDPDCAAKVVSLVNEPTTEPLIKGWLLALVLSLVHPEQGLNPNTQAALLRTGMPAALCRLVVRTPTPPEQRLQALTMLRVLVHDPETHPVMVETKVLHALVQQIGDVKVIRGQVVGPTPTGTGSTPTASPMKTGVKTKTGAAPTAANPTLTSTQGGEAYEIEQKNIELAVCMLGDMAPGPFHGEMLSSGAIKALTQCACDTTRAESVRAAAANTLSILMADGTLAVEAARDNLLVGLVTLLASPTPDVQQPAMAAIQQLLTPTPPMSLDTAVAAHNTCHGPLVSLPPQGKAAKLATRANLTTTAQPGTLIAATATASMPAASTTTAGIGAVAVATATGAGQTGAEVANELFNAMGKALSPESTYALMDLLAMDNPTLLPLALRFLPLTATDPACRAAIISHPKGVPVLLRQAGEKNDQAAIAALQRVASDHKLKTQVAQIIAQAVVAAGTNVQQAANLAGALVAAGDVPAGMEKDKPSVAAASAFAVEVLESGAIPMLTTLMKSLEARAKTKAAMALRMLCLYGDSRVKDAVVKSDAVVPLVEAAKVEEAGAPAERMPLCQAACDALAGLTADNEAVRTSVFTSLLGYLSSPTTSTLACQACLAIAGGSSGGYAALAKAGVLAPLLGVLGTAQGDALTAPCRLLAGVVASSSEIAEQAVTAGAGTCLPGCLQKGSQDAQSAAAAAAYHVMRGSETARNQIVDRQGLALLLSTVRACPATDPYFDDATRALATLATLHAGCRYEISRGLRQSVIKQNSPIEAAAAAGVCCRMAYSPQGREILASDDLLDGLVKLLSQTGNPAGQRLAADALLHVAGAASITVSPPPGSPAGTEPTTTYPKPQLVAKGSMEGLQLMLKSNDELVIADAAACMECLCGCEEGVKAAKRVRAQETLHDIIQAGKRGEVSERAAKACSSVYIKIV